MLKTVIDTNVIISAALSEKGNPSKILNLVLNKSIHLFYSEQIMNEYIEVLSRPRFNFNLEKQKYFIDGIKKVGILIFPSASNILLPDENDRIFYDLAKESQAILITGNIKHFPNEDFILTPTQFIEFIENKII